MEKYVMLLKKNRIKVTPQRLEILKYLDGQQNHPDVEMIFNSLKKRNPSLSRTTVYNTLDMLRSCNLVNVLTISETELRYDSIINRHHHFLCKECGEIIDIDVKCPFNDETFRGGHRIDEVHGYFKGVCQKCLKDNGG